jgi:hypothetical protein
VARISRERAERIAKAHVCSHCKEYSFKKLVVKPAPQSIEQELGAIWIAVRICGVCGHQGEIGIEADGDVVFES